MSKNRRKWLIIIMHNWMLRSNLSIDRRLKSMIIGQRFCQSPSAARVPLGSGPWATPRSSSPSVTPSPRARASPGSSSAFPFPWSAGRGLAPDRRADEWTPTLQLWPAYWPIYWSIYWLEKSPNLNRKLNPNLSHNPNRNPNLNHDLYPDLNQDLNPN